MKTKRIISVLLVLVMTLTLIPLTTFSTSAASVFPYDIMDDVSSGKLTPEHLTSEGDTYYLNSASDLAIFLWTVKNGNTYEGKTVLLNVDVQWNPKGTAEGWCELMKTNDKIVGSDYTYNWVQTEGAPFKGTFDGQGHSVSKICFYHGTPKTGFLGTVENGTVKNLSILDSFMFSAVTGGIVGVGINATIENCYVDAVVETARVAGGIMGYGTATIKDCVFAGTLIDRGAVGSNGHCGGIVGILANKGWSNVASTAASDPSDSFGTMESEIINCANLGTFLNRKKVSVDGTDTCYGGIVGVALTKSTITNCVNSAVITEITAGKTSFDGSIAGQIEDGTTVKNCYWVTGSGVNVIDKKSDDCVIENIKEIAEADLMGAKLLGKFTADYKGNFLMFANSDTLMPQYNPRALIARGYQTNAEGDIRLVGEVLGLEYEQVGFRVVATVGETSKEQTKLTNKVWTSIQAAGETVEASEDHYLFGAVLSGIPADQTITFTVYMVVDAGDGFTVTAVAGSFTCVNGVVA